MNQDPIGYAVDPNGITVEPYTDVVAPTWELVRTPNTELSYTGLDQTSAWFSAMAILMIGTAAMAASRRRRRLRSTTEYPEDNS